MAMTQFTGILKQVSYVCLHKWVLRREEALHEPGNIALHTGVLKVYHCAHCRMVKKGISLN